MPSRIARPLAALALLGWLAACAVNPATGDRQSTGVMPSEAESAVGTEEHPKIVSQFGGAYHDPKLQEFVDRVGRRLAQASAQAGEQQDGSYTVTVLDTDGTNAFALPGGYLYVTRGLLALANDAAEVAAVLAHEIGHITARHTAERLSEATKANILVAGLAAALGSPEAPRTLGEDSQGVLSSFSPDQELQADALAVRRLARAGFDPAAMSTVLATLRRDADLTALEAGMPAEEADRGGFFATHPQTAERVEKAAAEARREPEPPAPRERDREAYLQAIDGMVHGASPEHGLVRGRTFVHPSLGFRFEVPEGFRLINGERQVLAAGPDGAAIVFDAAPTRGAESMVDYLTAVWMPNAWLAEIEPLTIDDLPAATAVARGRIQGEGEVADVRLVAIRAAPRAVYRFMVVTPPGLDGRLGEALRQTTDSFRRLTAEKARRHQPQRIEVVTVQPGDTVETLARRMPPGPYPEERFRVLNDLPAGANLESGQRVKLVAD